MFKADSMSINEKSSFSNKENVKVEHSTEIKLGAETFGQSREDVGDFSKESEILNLVNEHVSYASILLAKLGPKYKTMSWMLEDALSYLSSIEEGEV